MGESHACAIDLHDVAKIYRGRVHALRGINLQVRPGEIFGLLGPNGAGKSTLVKIIMTVIRATRADGTVLGKPVGHKPTLARIGYLPENHRFPRYLTGRQTLEFFGALANADAATVRRRADELLATVRMSDWAEQKVGTYSKGMLQRIGLAQAMVHDPDLILLDEPTDGVDPVGRREILDVLGGLRRQGKTVFINSHQLSELESICDRVAILVKGQVARQGTIDDLTIARQRYEVEVVPQNGGDERARVLSLLGGPWQQVAAAMPAPMSMPASIPPPTAYAQWTAPAPQQVPATYDRGTLPGGKWAELHGATLRLGTIDPTDVQPIIDAMRGAGLILRRVELVRPSLEDLFMETVIDPMTGQHSGPGAARHPALGQVPMPAPMPATTGGSR
jgi:ABC-2 type transport system ATP-binding protein